MLIPILIGVGVYALLSFIVPRVNDRLNVRQTGNEWLVESPVGRVIVVVITVVLIAAIAISALE